MPNALIPYEGCDAWRDDKLFAAGRPQEGGRGEGDDALPVGRKRFTLAVYTSSPTETLADIGAAKPFPNVGGGGADAVLRSNWRNIFDVLYD